MCCVMLCYCETAHREAPLKLCAAYWRWSCAGINSREDVLKMGIGKYNEECRSIVMK